VLSRRVRLSGRDVALILAALVVWSNVHGSVLLVAPLVALRGALDLRPSTRRGRFDRRSLALLVGPWICMFASPYAFHLFSYYGRTAFNPTFSTYLSFWAPTTFSPISLPLLALVFALIWLLGRTSETYSTYERWLLVIAAIVGLMAVRNWPFTAMVAVMLAPVGFDRALRGREPRTTPWFGAPLAVGVLAATVIGVIAALGRPDAALTRDFPRDAGAVTVAGASNARIYAGVKFADWLMWAHPELEGKVVFDARYELLTNDEVKRLVLFGLGTGVDAPLDRPTMYVLDPSTDERAIDALRPHVHVLYDTDRVFVANAAGRR
jgi:hypothetical protein